MQFTKKEAEEAEEVEAYRRLRARKQEGKT